MPGIYKQKIINVRTNAVHKIEIFNAGEANGRKIVQTIPVGYAGNFLTASLMVNGLIDIASELSAQDHCPIAINVSNTLLVDADLLAVVLQRLQVMPCGLSIEVTQLGDLPAPRTLNATFSRLRQHNCTVEFDNFGGPNGKSPQVLSGYSFDSIKLNSTFSRKVLGAPRYLRLLKLIVDMVNAQGKDVVATGVSAQAESENLEAIGVYLQQGDYIHPPEFVA